MRIGPKFMDVNVTINNCTQNELEIIKLMFNGRIEVKILPEEPKKDAPRKPGRPKKTVSVANEEAPKVVLASTTPDKEAEEHKPTKKEALDAWKTEKYGPIEVRREYVKREEEKKALERKIRAEVMDEIALEVKEKRGGQRYPYVEYCKIRDERIAKRLEEIEKEAAKAKKATRKTTAKKTTKTTKK